WKGGGGGGFCTDPASIDVAIIRENPTASSHRRWVGIAASVGTMTPTNNIPQDFTLTINNFTLVDNVADATDGKRLNWTALASQAGGTSGVDNTQIAGRTRTHAL